MTILLAKHPVWYPFMGHFFFLGLLRFSLGYKVISESDTKPKKMHGKSIFFNFCKVYFSISEKYTIFGDD
jgi:hypothetical protein